MHIPTCQHIKLNGVRCGSPALRGKSYCYFHDEWRFRSPDDPCPKPKHPDAVSLATATGIQIALNKVLSGLVSGRLGTARASLALQAIQLAASNLRTLQTGN